MPPTGTRLVPPELVARATVCGPRGSCPSSGAPTIEAEPMLCRLTKPKRCCLRLISIRVIREQERKMWARIALTFRLLPKRPEKNIEKFFFFQAEDGIRDYKVTGVQTCALPI